MDGDEYINCPEGEIIMVDLVTFGISCGADDGRCPGAFSVGCDTDTEAPTTTEASVSWVSLNCEVAPSLKLLELNKQMFIILRWITNTSSRLSRSPGWGLR